MDLLTVDITEINDLSTLELMREQLAEAAFQAESWEIRLRIYRKIERIIDRLIQLEGC